MNKYEIVKEYSIIIGMHRVCRIRALIDFGDVKAGDLGGYIESESNLSQEGEAWIYDDACAFGKAKVSGNAKIRNKAQISGHAWIYGDADISGCAKIFGNAVITAYAQITDYVWVSGDATVHGNARIFGNAKINGHSEIYGYAKIGGNAHITGQTYIYDFTEVYGEETEQEDRITEDTILVRRLAPQCVDAPTSANIPHLNPRALPARDVSYTTHTNLNYLAINSCFPLLL